MKFPQFKKRPALPEECKCACHKGAPLLHPVDCCKQCPICGRDIATAFYQAHIDKCGLDAVKNSTLK